MTSAYEQGTVPDFAMRHRLQLAREHAGYTRQQLADAIEVSRNTVLNAETGKTAPRKLMINAWALACGVPASWLATGTQSGPQGGPPGSLLLPRMDSNHQPPGCVRRHLQPVRDAGEFKDAA